MVDRLVVCSQHGHSHQCWADRLHRFGGRHRRDRPDVLFLRFGEHAKSRRTEGDGSEHFDALLDVDRAIARGGSHRIRNWVGVGDGRRPFGSAVGEGAVPVALAIAVGLFPGGDGDLHVDGACGDLANRAFGAGRGFPLILASRKAFVVCVDTPLSGALSIRVTGVQKTFGEGPSQTTVLRNVNFDAMHGEMLLLVGPSGCGKTTLLSIIAGTMNADAGDIEVLGQRIDRMASSEVTRFRARHIGFIFQQFNLIPTLSIAENVSVPLLIQGRRSGAAERQAREMLGRVGLGDKTHLRPGKLSGGQQQRAAIARALVHDPPLVSCDEPTSALDSENGRQVMEILRSIARDPNRCVVIVTHDNRTYRFADRMAEMEDGVVCRVLGSSDEIAAKHQTQS